MILIFIRYTTEFTEYYYLQYFSSHIYIAFEISYLLKNFILKILFFHTLISFVLTTEMTIQFNNWNFGRWQVLRHHPLNLSFLWIFHYIQHVQRHPLRAWLLTFMCRALNDASSEFLQQLRLSQVIVEAFAQEFTLPRACTELVHRR